MNKHAYVFQTGQYTLHIKVLCWLILYIALLNKSCLSKKYSKLYGDLQNRCGLKVLFTISQVQNMSLTLGSHAFHKGSWAHTPRRKWLQYAGWWLIALTPKHQNASPSCNFEIMALLLTCKINRMFFRMIIDEQLYLECLLWWEQIYWPTEHIYSVICLLKFFP